MSTTPRDFTYIKPHANRLSEYEAVTCFTQPDPDVMDAPGWFVRTPEGRPMWLRDSTLLQHPCWFDFRDPARHWQRTYVKMQAEQERSLELLLEDAMKVNAFDGFSREWTTEILGGHYRVWPYFEYGVFRCFAQSQRETLSDTLGNAFCFEAVDRMRHAQDVVLYLMELEDSIPGFQEQDPKELWLRGEAYQPARRMTEELMVLQDWGELAVAVNLIVDPIFSEMGISQLLRRHAAQHGDYITPAIVMSVERDRRRNQAWTAELVKMVLAEEVSARDQNRRLIQEWVERWTPRAVAAARGLMPLFDRLGAGFSEALSLVWTGYTAELTSLGLAPGSQGA